MNNKSKVCTKLTLRNIENYLPNNRPPKHVNDYWLARSGSLWIDASLDEFQDLH